MTGWKEQRLEMRQHAQTPEVLEPGMIKGEERWKWYMKEELQEAGALEWSFPDFVKEQFMGQER